MKNFFKSLAICALAALTFASCQKENADGNMDDQSSVVSINLTSPLMGTKAFADGKTVDVVHVHVYKVGADNTLTYIAPGTGGTETPSKDVTMEDNGTATYSTRLVTGQKYTFVFWAEKSSEENYNSPYTYDSANQTITVNYDSATGNDERRDAFYAVLENVQITGAYSHNVTLTRPFAQVNFGVTAADMAYANAAGITSNNAAVKCTNVANQLNLLDGKVSGSEDVAFASTAFVSTALPSEALIVAGTTYTYVAMNYVLVGKAASTLSDITLTLEATGAASATPEYTHTFHNIPLQGNFRTNIVGDLFTSPANINITVEANFDGDENEVITNVGSISAANTALRNGATNISISNITTSEAGTTKLQMPATSESITIAIENIESTANLQIEKPATGSNPTSVSLTVPPAANVSNLTINLPESHVEINGATYTSINATTSNNTLVIGEDVTVETLTIESGAVEIYGKVKDLVKGEGAGEVKVWTVYTGSQLQKAIYITKQIVLGKGISTGSTIKINKGADVEIDLNEFYIKNFVQSTAPLKIENAKVKFKGTGKLSATSSYVMQIVGSGTDAANYTVVSIGKDVTVSNSKKNTWGIFIDNDAAGTYNNYGIVLNIEGTITNQIGAGAITINGSNINTTGNVPIINFNGANIDFGSLGIYAAGYAKWNLKNTNITGKLSAMEVRAGEVTIDGGEYKATNTPFSIKPNGNGTTISGAALGISQHTTDLPINVVVNSGTFTGEYAVYEEDVQNNTAKDKIKLAVNGGTFNGAIYSQNNQNCLVGGTYNDASVFNYTAEGYECLLNANDTYTVVTARDAGFYKDGDDIVISNPNGLKLFAMKVNSLRKTFAGKKLSLAADIDLDGVEWAPIGQTGATQFMGTFNAQNHTIKNLQVSNNDEGGNCASGLFGWLNSAIVKNLKISVANITGHHNVGTIAGYLETSGCTIENCFVENATISCTSANGEANGDKCGGIVGHAGNAGVVVKDCTVSNSSIYAGRDAGQVVGAALEANVQNCSATDVTVTANGTSTGANIRNEVIGRVLLP